MTWITGLALRWPNPVVYGLGWLALGLAFWRSATRCGRAAVGVLALLWGLSAAGLAATPVAWVAIGLGLYFAVAGPLRWLSILLTPVPSLVVGVLDGGMRRIGGWRRIRPFPGWVGGLAAGLGGALMGLGLSGPGPMVPAGAAAFLLAWMARRVPGWDVLRPVGLGSVVWTALGWSNPAWVDACRAVGLTWWVGWTLPVWLHQAWTGWPWESRRRVALWVLVGAAVGWAWVDTWRGSGCGREAAGGPGVWTVRDWYGIQVVPSETWEARAETGVPPKPAAVPSSEGACHSIPWTAGLSATAVWEVFRPRPCDPTAVWRIDVQVVSPVGSPTEWTQRVPVCVWPMMNRVTWTFTAAFPTRLMPEARELRICSQMEPPRAAGSLNVRLVEVRPNPPLLVIEDFRVRRLEPRRYALDVAVWNPGPRRLWGWVLVGLVSARPGSEAFRWLGVRRFPVTLGPGEGGRRHGEVTTVRSCETPGAGIRVVEAERGLRGFAWGRLSPPGETARGPLPPAGPPMCGPTPPATEPIPSPSPDPTACQHTEP